MSAELTIALCGNPNSGKSTIFNALTGSRQHVGNYPGVTVEKKEGWADCDGVRMKVVDLPGTYSLSARSLDEVVARDFIIDERPDVVVDIVDASNLERNLYLATQLLELGVPLVLAFNMSDVASARGYSIDDRRLSQLLGVPIVHTVGHRGEGLADLLRAAVAAGRDSAASVAAQRRPQYGGELEPHVEQLTRRLAERCGEGPHNRWFALKLLEADEGTRERLAVLCPAHAAELSAEADKLRGHIRGVSGESPEILLADGRYGFISGACTESVRQTVERRHELSDKIDAVLLNRFLGLPIFAVMMYLVFQLTFTLGNPLVDALDSGKSHLATAVRSLDPSGTNVLVDLLAGGVIEGVGAVLAFTPLIVLLFASISALEDSGYMARGAFVLDRLMHRVGLHGKSFIPMLIGFGCTVPAVMATRILENRRDRLITMLVLPLMSCGARLPVYVLMLGAFFAPRAVLRFGRAELTNQAVILLAVYAAGISLAVVCIKLLRATVFRGEAAPFVMELPPYRLPALRGLTVHTLERTWSYVRKAGTIILGIVIVLWALKTWPMLDEQSSAEFAQQRQAVATAAASGALDEQAAARQVLHIAAAEHRAALQHSAIGHIGRFIAPALRPCGFDWKVSTALLGSFAAKEVFISQMGIVYAEEHEADEQSASLRSKLAADYTPLQGLCMMLFILVATPCAATVAVVVRESGSWKWAALQWGGLTVLAWLLTTALYQAGSVILSFRMG